MQLALRLIGSRPKDAAGRKRADNRRSGFLVRTDRLKPLESAKHATSNWANARARWLMVCFSAASISPNVFAAAARHEHRIIAKALVAARRPDRRAVDPADEGLGVAVRPGEAQCGDEPGAPIRGVAHLAVHPRHRGGKILGGPRPARGIARPGAPFSAATQKPKSSASAGRPLARAAASALMRALPTKSGASSGGSGRPSAPAETTATSCGRSRSASSASLPGLWLARTSRVPPASLRAITPRRLPRAAPRTAPRHPGARGPACRGTAPR